MYYRNKKNDEKEYLSFFPNKSFFGKKGVFKTKSEDLCYYSGKFDEIEIDNLDEAKIFDFIKYTKKNPPNYNFPTQQCATLVLRSLQVGKPDDMSPFVFIDMFPTNILLPSQIRVIAEQINNYYDNYNKKREENKHIIEWINNMNKRGNGVQK